MDVRSGSKAAADELSVSLNETKGALLRELQQANPSGQSTDQLIPLAKAKAAAKRANVEANIAKIEAELAKYQAAKAKYEAARAKSGIGKPE